MVVNIEEVSFRDRKKKNKAEVTDSLLSISWCHTLFPPTSLGSSRSVSELFLI